MSTPSSRSTGSVLLAGSALAISAFPALQFTYWQWIVLALAGPVTVWGAWPFHRSAWTSGRHGRITLDTLVSVAVVAATAWTVLRLVGPAGTPGLVEPLRWTEATAPLTVAVAAGIVAVLLVGVPTPLADPAARAASWYTPIVIALAVAAFGYRFGTGHAEGAFATAVTVLLVGCPAALTLAVPFALRRAPAVTEPARRVEVAVLAGPVPVDRMVVEPGVPDEVLRLAGSVTTGVADPIAEAIALAGRERSGELPGVADFDSKPGAGWLGIVAELNGDTVVAHAVVVGSPDLLADYGIGLPAALEAAIATAEAAGRRAVAVAWEGVARAVIALSAVAPQQCVEAVAELRDTDLRPVLLSADPMPLARTVGAAVGIPAGDVVAEPADRVAAVRERVRPGRAVAVIGDDALAAAVGEDAVAGADAAAVVAAVRRSRHTYGVVRGNVAGALAGHVVAAPAAAGGLVGPAAAGAAIGFGVLWVVAHSLRLRRVGPPVRATDR